MEALYMPPWQEEELKEGEGEKSGEASSPLGSTSDEEETDSEPEPTPIIRRKVSFADAFGLNLVSVKEFDNAEGKGPEASPAPEREAARPLEDVYVSCLFTVPSSPEELDQRLQAQMVELESIELLPGTSTIRGVIRVVNLCYCKTVYVRVSLDRWTSYFDLLAEYIPGSSDRKTDRFNFKYTLVPPFEREGTRVEMCLCYDTSAGTFWANNKGMNYVLFCHQRGHVNEPGPPVQEEGASCKSKRSCLKTKRRGSAAEKTRDTSGTSPVVAEAADEVVEADGKTIDGAEIQEGKALLDSIKNRHRATRLARVQDYLTRGRQNVPKSHSHDSQPLPSRQKRQSSDSPRMLTYHEIPLLTLDWNADRAHQRGTYLLKDIGAGRTKLTPGKAAEECVEDVPSVEDMWEIFCNGAGDTAVEEVPVCDIWQQFLNGPSCADHSGVPESEWLQTAASVSPSNGREAKTQFAERCRENEFQADTLTTSRARTSCQLSSGACRASPDNVALNAADHRSCVSAATPDASRGSETNSLQEFSLEGATPLSKGTADSSAECHKPATGEKQREGMKDAAEGAGGEEAFRPLRHDLVTSSGELAAAEPLNASAVDRISQGARFDEGLSSSRGGQETGTMHNMMDDMLAFRQSIGQAEENGVRSVFSTSRQGAEEAFVNNKGSTGEEIFRPRKTERCEISLGCSGDKQHKRKNNRENPCGETESDDVQSHADGFSTNQSCDEDFERSHQSEDVSLIVGDPFKEAAAAPSCEETKRLIDEEAEISQVLNQEARKQHDEALHVDLSRRSGAHNEPSRPVQAEAEMQSPSPLTRLQDDAPTESQIGELVLVSNQTDGEAFSRCDGIIEEEEEEEIKPPAQMRPRGESKEMIPAVLGENETFGPFSADNCNSNPSEEMKTRWTPSHEDAKGRIGDISPEGVTAKENIASSTEPQGQGETLERIEGDSSQGGKDERVSIGKLKIEARGELMGDAGFSRAERKNVPAQWEEPELSVEVKSSTPVEYKKVSGGTKESITSENAAALEMMESGSEAGFVERFGEDLMKGILEEVFNLKAWSYRELSIAGGIEGKLTDTPDKTQDCHIVEEDLDDSSDPVVLGLMELPSYPNSSLCHGPEQTLAAKSFAEDVCQSLLTVEQTHFLSELERELNPRPHQLPDLAPVLAARTELSLTESAQSSPNGQEDIMQITERSAARQERGGQTEERVVTHKESFNPSSEKLQVSVWWTILFLLSQVTRILICTLVVAGFFYVVFLCDFPAFFALYMSSLCWWFYKWRRHGGTADKAMAEE